MRHYFTFGQVHAHAIPNLPTFDKDCVAVIEAPNHSEAREIAFKTFGAKFCFSYPEDQWSHSQMMPYYPRGYIALNFPQEELGR